MASIFTRIVQGEIPCYKIAENDHFLAFLDVNPLVKGHTLVIPKKEQDYLFDLENDSFVGLHLFAKDVAIQLKKHIDCKRIGVAVIGLEVPHAHIHLIPLNEMDDINFNRKKLTLSPEELTSIADELKMF
ncbi:MAG: HIT domain-containing protein [Crocinitomicaceae bacterium]|nr:HIT domain-containing protein [Crocinitomicaceae bacterium]MBP6033620.1 HIT domain-containing protein [Crocinitomicaceae bacterium]